ncbi:MAG: sporulation protein YunB [Oscillospiraceae bacterium]|nr:sporulation protein YunB [Oscillospiraceae bacterium]
MFYIWIDTQIRPGVAQVAGARVRNLATMSINEAVLDVLSREGVGYDDLITFERDGSGEIRALRTNMAGVNALKAEVSAEVLRRVESINRSDLAIPIGNLSSNRLLMGRGPRIGVRIVPIGAVTADLENNFSAAGINQTQHQIVMNLDFHMGVLTMSQNTDVTVRAQVVIAETIIVGKVPDAYAGFGDVFRQG